MLELLLFYAIARQDTNLLAHRLLDQFGSFSRVVEAPIEELRKVEGVGESTAIYLRLLYQSWKRYQQDRVAKMKVLPTIESCAQYLAPRFAGEKKEAVYLLCLDSKCRLLCCTKIAQGTANYTNLPIRKIVETALNANAVSVVLAHNHPDGVAIPSHEDIGTTRNVAAALKAVDINFVDHLIVSEEDFVSLMQSGYLMASGAM